MLVLTKRFQRRISFINAVEISVSLWRTGKRVATPHASHYADDHWINYADVTARKCGGAPSLLPRPARCRLRRTMDSRYLWRMDFLDLFSFHLNEFFSQDPILLKWTAIVKPEFSHWYAFTNTKCIVELRIYEVQRYVFGLCGILFDLVFIYKASLHTLFALTLP